MAEDGAENSEAELAASIAGLFRPHSEKKPNTVERFPARAAWLIEQLAINREQLPVQESAKVAEITSTLQPRAISVLFPDAYLSSPASAFGHSLLTLQGSNDNPLNDLAINYAAVTGESGGLGYVARGITGGFSGKYSYMPYHQKMAQYAHGDQRDQWVYRLDLNQEEVLRVVKHLVDLTDIASDYYFFDENCAFNILYLIEVARPGVNLVDHTRPWVIPLDTLRLLKKNGLIDDATWRPSSQNELRLLGQQLSKKENAYVRDVANGRASVDDVASIGGDDPHHQAFILDLVAKYLFTLRFANAIDVGTYRQRLLPLLRARAKLPKRNHTTSSDSKIENQAAAADHTEDPYADVAPPAPTTGHGTSRVQLSAGVVKDRGYVELGWRPAYHDLSDPAAGFTKSGLQFLNITARWYDGADRPEIGTIDFLRVHALPQRDQWFQPWSWTAGIRLSQEPVLENQARRLDLIGNVGGGVSWGGRRWLLSLLAETEARTTEGDEHHAAGLGGSIDSLWQLHQKLGFRAQIRVIDNMLGDTTTDFTATGTLIIGSGRNWAGQISGGWRHAWELDDFLGQATLSYYW